jgi:ribosomal protein S18 acetylase RimI-like enzyme
MMVKNRSFQKYQDILKGKGLELHLLDKVEGSLGRLVNIFIKLDSIYLSTQHQESEIQSYAKKLNDHAYNFVLVDQKEDIGILSFYANDFVHKTAFVSSLGVLPAYQRNNYASILWLFLKELLKELEFSFVKCEINKDNFKSISLVSKFNFTIEIETENNSYIMVREIK